MLRTSISKVPIREVLIGVTVAVCAGFLGYKVNDYLSRDKISIERVDLIANTTKLPYPLKEMMEINKSPRFQNYLLSRGLTVYQFNPGFYNRPSRSSLQKQDVDDIIRVLEDFSKFDEELQAREHAAIKQLENYKTGDNLSGIWSTLSYSGYRLAPLVASTDTEKAKNMLDFIKNERSNIEVVHQYKNAILSVLKSFKPERTGMVTIKLILLNSGNTDGLVKPDGELHIGNRNDPVYIIEKNLYDEEVDDTRYFYIQYRFQSVPKRSLVQRIFTINESKTAQGTLNEFKSMVKRGLATPTRITLFDIRDDPIRSRDSQLPVIQE